MGIRSSQGNEGDDCDDVFEGQDGDESESDDGCSAIEEFDNGWGMVPPAAAAAGEAVLAAPPGVSECKMETAEQTFDLLGFVAAIAEELRSWGDVAGASFMELQIMRERRRVREMPRVNFARRCRPKSG